ncbi:POTRA domain, ShlB-type [compost metagenome]
MHVLPVVLLLASGMVSAAPLPAWFNTNETESNLPSANLPVDTYRPRGPAVQVPGEKPAPALAMGTRVMLRNLRIEGGSVYSLAELAELYKPLIGRETSLAELIEATRQVTRRYREDGYLLSYAFLPPQRFDDGQVRVVLVEGHVTDYRLEGEVGPVGAQLRRMLEKIRGERPLTRRTFQRYTTLMSRLPGISLQAQVAPPVTTDGATVLVARATRKPWDSSLNLSDGSRNDPQALLTVTSNAHTGVAEQLSAGVLVPPGEDREHYYRLDYSQYLDSEGTQLSLFASRYRSEPRANLRLENGIELERERDNDRLSIGVSQPFVAAPVRWLSAALRLYAVRDESRFSALGLPFAVSSESDIRVLALETDWRKADPDRLRLLSAGIYRGIDGLGANSDTDLYDLDFLRLRVSGAQSDRYGERWQGVISAALYWSEDNLPDAEQVVFGEQSFGRGYPSDQASGDKGWGVAYELNRSFSRDSRWLPFVQPYVLVDAARAWFNEQPVSHSELSSAALGVRFGNPRHYNIALEAARPMSDVALDSGNRRPRFMLSFSYRL